MRAAWAQLAFGILLITLVITMTMGTLSCVPIPYPVKPDVAQSETITLSTQETLVTLGPRELLEKVAKKIQEASDNIEVVDGLTFRDTTFPEGGWTLSLLLEHENCERVRNELDVRYLVLVSRMQQFQGETIGEIMPIMFPAGAVTGDTGSGLTAVIVDLQRRETLCELTAEAHGYASMVIFFGAVIIMPMTNSAAIRGLADEVANVITNQVGTKSVRIAVMAAEPTWGRIATTDAKQTQDCLQKLIESKGKSTLRTRAECGEANAQWYLYFTERADISSLKWLCRAADQGMSRAQIELAEQYEHGTRMIHQDLAQSYIWYSLAARGGVEDSRSKLEKLTNNMTLEQIEEAEKKLAAWTPGQCEQALLMEEPED